MFQKSFKLLPKAFHAKLVEKPTSKLICRFGPQTRRVHCNCCRRSQNSNKVAAYHKKRGGGEKFDNHTIRHSHLPLHSAFFNQPALNVFTIIWPRPPDTIYFPWKVLKQYNGAIASNVLQHHILITVVYGVGSTFVFQKTWLGRHFVGTVVHTLYHLKSPKSTIYRRKQRGIYLGSPKSRNANGGPLLFRRSRCSIFPYFRNKSARNAWNQVSRRWHRCAQFLMQILRWSGNNERQHHVPSRSFSLTSGGKFPMYSRLFPLIVGSELH